MNFFLKLSRPFNSDFTREKWIGKRLKAIPAKESILDAGAGECKYKPYCRHLEYTSQDFAQYKGDLGDDGLHPKSWNTSKIDIISDIISIPVKRGSFDNVLCSEVLEHIAYPELAIKELSRILKKGGKLILTAPFCCQTHFAPYFYYTGFSTYWYKEVFRKYNLEIISLIPNGNFFDYIVQELLRLPLTLKKYSYFGWFSLALYVPILPFVCLLTLISKLSRDSERQLCFGWYVLAKKK